MLIPLIAVFSLGLFVTSSVFDSLAQGSAEGMAIGVNRLITLYTDIFLPLIIVTIAISLIMRLAHDPMAHTEESNLPDPIDVLKEEYIEGEIGLQEFEEEIYHEIEIDIEPLSKAEEEYIDGEISLDEFGEKAEDAIDVEQS